MVYRHFEIFVCDRLRLATRLSRCMLSFHTAPEATVGKRSALITALSSGFIHLVGWSAAEAQTARAASSRAATRPRCRRRPTSGARSSPRTRECCRPTRDTSQLDGNVQPVARPALGVGLSGRATARGNWLFARDRLPPADLESGRIRMRPCASATSRSLDWACDAARRLGTRRSCSTRSRTRSRQLESRRPRRRRSSAGLSIVRTTNKAQSEPALPGSSLKRRAQGLHRRHRRDATTPSPPASIERRRPRLQHDRGERA